MSDGPGQSRPKAAAAPRTKTPWLWNVVLLDDQDHTDTYVVRMMQSLFGHDRDRAERIAVQVDQQGRAVCITTHKEHAELKREQILAFGHDPDAKQCRGPMSAVIEPAEGGDDDPPGA